MPRGPYISSGRKGPKRTTESVNKLHGARATTQNDSRGFVGNGQRRKRLRRA